MSKHATFGGLLMIAHDSVLVQLVDLVDHLPTPTSSTIPRRGRPVVYSDRLFIKALVIMIVRRLHKVGELLAVLEEPTPELRSLREILSEPNGRFPSRRTFERRLIDQYARKTANSPHIGSSHSKPRSPYSSTKLGFVNNPG